MFLDYYKVLEIAFPSSLTEIKSAYRKQAKKWHPDINPSDDANDRMILVYEAYLILSDQEAKIKYDNEYLRFTKNEQKNNKKKQEYHSKEQRSSTTNQHASSKSYTQSKEKPFEYEFEPDDDILSKWMSNARRQASEMAKKSFDEAMGMTKVAIMEGAKKTGQMFIGQIILGLVITIIFALSKGCN